MLRVGGNSADSTCFEFTQANPNCKYNQTTAGDLRAYTAAADAARTLHNLNVTFVLDTPLGGSTNPQGLPGIRPDSGVRLVKALLREDMFTPRGCVAALEIGNEPDSYWTTHPASHIDDIQRYAVRMGLRDERGPAWGVWRAQYRSRLPLAPNFSLSQTPHSTCPTPHSKRLPTFPPPTQARACRPAGCRAAPLPVCSAPALT